MVFSAQVLIKSLALYDYFINFKKSRQFKMFTPAMWFDGGTISAGAVSNLERVSQAQLWLGSAHVGACGEAGENTPELSLVSAELGGQRHSAEDW